MSEICKTEPLVEKEKSWSENLDSFIQWASSCRMDQSGEINLDSKPELYKEVKKYEKLHKLGETLYQDGELPEIKDASDKYYVVTGSVDRTKFSSKLKRKDDFYGNASETAADLAASWNSVAIDFPSLNEDEAKSKKMHEIIQEIANMTDKNDDAFKKLIANKGYSEDEIYGAEGALNMLLAYDRALASSASGLAESTLIKKVKISVAKEEGKKRKSRYTKVYEFLKPEEKKASVVIKKPEEGEKPVVPKKEPEQPKAPETPKKPAEKPKAPAKAPETLSSLDNMVNQFGAAGFNVVWKPAKMDNMSGYSKYGKHRVSFACNADGSYSFKVLTMPAGRTEVKGDKVTAAVAKAQLDAIAGASDVDMLKAAELDLNKAIFRDFEGKILGLKVEKKGDEHHVTIMNYRFKKLDGSVAGPKDVTFEVNIEKVNNSKVLYKGYNPKKIPLPEHTDLNAFLQNAARSSMAAMME